QRFVVSDFNRKHMLPCAQRAQRQTLCGERVGFDRSPIVAEATAGIATIGLAIDPNSTDMRCPKRIMEYRKQLALSCSSRQVKCEAETPHGRLIGGRLPPDPR